MKCPTLLALCFVALFSPVMLMAASETAETPVLFTLQLLDAEPPRVKVTVEVAGAADGVSSFYVQPHWGGVTGCESEIHDVQAQSEGVDLPVERAADRPNAWTVRHAPGATLRVSHILHNDGIDRLGQPGNHYRPIVRDGLVHVIGQTALLLPQWLEEDTPRDVRLHWRGFSERGWAAVSSFDAVAPGEPIRIGLAQFRHALFMAGRIRVHDCDIRGQKLRVAVSGDEWDFGDDEFVSLVRRIVETERDYFDDHSDPYYLVSLIPSGKRQPNSMSLGGTGLTNCFALFLQPGPDLKPGSRTQPMVTRLLAHEYFHNWNGLKINTGEETEGLSYWFSEGFTDYFASRLLRKAELIDDALWLAWLNESMTALWTNPHCNATNADIAAGFWKNRDLQKLPYQRGELVALLLNAEIQRASDGARSIDDFMREVLVAATKSGEKVTTERLLARMEKWTSPQFAQRIRGIVQDGQLPQEVPDLAIAGLVGKMTQRHMYDLGFDLDGSLVKKVAVGVRESGPAWNAGLREGTPVVGWSVYHGDTEKAVTLTIKEEAGEKKIEYWPRGKEISAPNYAWAREQGTSTSQR